MARKHDNGISRKLLDELIAERPVTKSIGFPPPMRCRSAD